MPPALRASTMRGVCTWWLPSRAMLWTMRGSSSCGTQTRRACARRRAKHNDLTASYDEQLALETARPKTLATAPKLRAQPSRRCHTRPKQVLPPRHQEHVPLAPAPRPPRPPLHTRRSNWGCTPAQRRSAVRRGSTPGPQSPCWAPGVWSSEGCATAEGRGAYITYPARFVAHGSSMGRGKCARARPPACRQRANQSTSGIMHGRRCHRNCLGRQQATGAHIMRCRHAFGATPHPPAALG